MTRIYGITSALVLCMVGVVFGATKTWNFDDSAVGATPAGWKSESMNKASPLATFKIVADATAPGAAAGNKVLTVAEYNPATAYEDYHVFWTEEISFTDGTIEVDSKATASDGYGGGIAFRIKDKNNYYAIRYAIRRPDISLFKISNGTRINLGNGTKTFSDDTWYHIKIVVKGTNITISVDGTEVLTKTDDSIMGSGGVGVFQRANRIASWDNFSVNN